MPPVSMFVLAFLRSSRAEVKAGLSSIECLDEAVCFHEVPSAWSPSIRDSRKTAYSISAEADHNESDTAVSAPLFDSVFNESSKCLNAADNADSILSMDMTDRFHESLFFSRHLAGTRFFLNSYHMLRFFGECLAMRHGYYLLYCLQARYCLSQPIY